MSPILLSTTICRIRLTRLPPELVNIILDLLDSTDVATLGACALISPEFCSGSQSILFRSLTLKGRTDEVLYSSNYIEAGTLFSESPHLGRTSALRRCVIEGGERVDWSQLGVRLGVELVQFLLASRCSLCLHIPPSLVDLVLDAGTGSVSELLVDPEHSAHTRDLRRISTWIPPALLSFEIELEFSDRAESWVSDTILAILASKRPSSSPSSPPSSTPSDSDPAPHPLRELTITYLPQWSYSPAGSEYADCLTALDGWLAAHRTVPHLRWRIRFVGVGRAERFARLREFIEEHLPRLAVMQRVDFETYEPPSWEGGFM
ncbi:hypothetical protein DFH09DRAFT_1285909 [Mycena vulgaris]|nr:hypothetical protein DFH09DRAFT_1285909 [Mycena vulgaris]